MEDDGVKSNTIEEAKAEREFIELVQYSTANFDDGKFGGMGRMGRRGKDTKVSFNFLFRANRVEKSGDGVSVRLGASRKTAGDRLNGSQSSTALASNNGGSCSQLVGTSRNATDSVHDIEIR